VSLLETPAPNAPLADADGDTRDKPGSLLPVIRVIPPEAYERPTWKGLAYFGRDLAVYALVLAGLFLWDNPIAVVALWVLSSLVISSLFIVGHDAAHEALFTSKRLNSIVGHAAMLPSWHVFEGWVLGHNRVHHKYTCRQGMDFVWHPVTPAQYAEMSGFAKLRHKLEWSWLGAGAYYVREIWWHKMMVGKPPARWAKAIRRDRWIILAWIVATCGAAAAAGFAKYGTVVGALWLPIKMFVVPFLAFCYVIGSIVHVHHIAPSIRWWGRREWSKFKGQMEGTTILRVVPGLNFFFHWITIHIPHHVDVRIPMYNLELAADAIKAEFPDVVHDEKLRYRDFVANTRACKLYDFDAGRWMTYAEADAFLAAAPTDGSEPVDAAASPLR
jgi:omega-6 fatty acid desaturase (delta-12 desaturase)